MAPVKDKEAEGFIPFWLSVCTGKVSSASPQKPSNKETQEVERKLKPARSWVHKNGSRILGKARQSSDGMCLTLGMAVIHSLSV